MDKIAISTNEKMKRLLNMLSCSNTDIDMDEVLDNMESMGNKKILAQYICAITETREFERRPDGSWGSETYTVTERTKSFAGNRNVYLTSKAREILRQAAENLTMGT